MRLEVCCDFHDLAHCGGTDVCCAWCPEIQPLPAEDAIVDAPASYTAEPPTGARNGQE